MADGYGGGYGIKDQPDLCEVSQPGHPAVPHALRSGEAGAAVVLRAQPIAHHDGGRKKAKPKTRLTGKQSLDPSPKLGGDGEEGLLEGHLADGASRGDDGQAGGSWSRKMASGRRRDWLENCCGCRYAPGGVRGFLDVATCHPAPFGSSEGWEGHDGLLARHEGFGTGLWALGSRRGSSLREIDAPQGEKSPQGVLGKFYGGALVQWESGRQPFCTLSTAEVGLHQGDDHGRLPLCHPEHHRRRMLERQEG